MFQALSVIVVLLVSFVRWILRLGSSGSMGVTGTAIIGVIVGTVILKIIDFILLGVFTYTVSSSIIDNLISLIRVQFYSLNNFKFVPDLLVTLHFPEALSMIVSALSIALTISGTKTVLRLKK